MQALRFDKNEFPEEVLKRHRLQSIGDEVRIYFAKPDAVLPVLLNGEPRFILWGNRRKLDIPRTGFCKRESFEARKWLWFKPKPVTIIASAALVNGVWFQVRQGIQGLLLVSKDGDTHGYIMTQPSTHYFRTMTGSERMPILINQIV